MRNLFEVNTYTEIKERIEALTPQSQALWGKMNVAQMLTHCQRAFAVPLSEKKMPRMLLGILVGWAIKQKLYNDEPWKRNLPTAPHFRITDERDFEKEKQKLVEMIDRFYSKGPTQVGRFPHPVFGSFTPEQWGKSMYKHVDHHLRQFGV